jgi:hypothetical protein
MSADGSQIFRDYVAHLEPSLICKWESAESAARILSAKISTGSIGYFKSVSTYLFSTISPAWYHCILTFLYLVFTGRWSKKHTLVEMATACITFEIQRRQPQENENLHAEQFQENDDPIPMTSEQMNLPDTPAENQISVLPQEFPFIWNGEDPILDPKQALIYLEAEAKKLNISAHEESLIAMRNFILDAGGV